MICVWYVCELQCSSRKHRLPRLAHPPSAATDQKQNAAKAGAAATNAKPNSSAAQGPVLQWVRCCDVCSLKLRTQALLEPFDSSTGSTNSTSNASSSSSNADNSSSSSSSKKPAAK